MDKPVMLATTREYFSHPVGRRFLEPLSHELGREIIFLENAAEADLKQTLQFELERWKTYMEQYIKPSDAAARPLWEVVHSALAAEGVIA